MKKVCLSLGFILVIGALVLLLRDKSMVPSDGTPQEQVQEKNEWFSTEGTRGAPGEKNLWRMSSDQLLFSAPSEYEVTQSDAGGTSTVLVSEEKDHTDQLSFRVALLMGEAGETLSKEEMILAEKRTLQQGVNCDARIVDGMTMECYRGEQNGKTVTLLFGPLDASTMLFIRQAYTSQVALDAVLASLLLRPTEKEMVGSRIIP